MHKVDGLHYKPSDGYFGDPIPFYDNGMYHIFFDKLRKDGKVCWGHIQSRELSLWEELPDAIEPGRYGEIDEAQCLTGSVVQHDGVFHAYYTGVAKTGRVNICHAISYDLITWHKDLLPAIPKDTKHYMDDETWRDPCVISNYKEENYWMVFCSRSPDKDARCFSGALGLAKSVDLKDWTIYPPVWSPHISSVVECPDMFKIGDKWILLYFWHETRCMFANQPEGPWAKHGVQAPDSFDFFAGKTMANGDKRILIGWIPRKSCDCGERIWGGSMALPRELYLLPDGSPATKCVPEVCEQLISHSKRCIETEFFSAITGEWVIEKNRMVGNAVYTGALAFWSDAPADYFMSFSIRLSYGSDVSFLIRTNRSESFTDISSKAIDEGYQLIFDALEKTIKLRELYVWDQRPDIAYIHYDFSGEEYTNCKLFLHGDILELFAGEKRSLVSRLLKHPNGGLGIHVGCGCAELAGLSIVSLSGREETI